MSNWIIQGTVKKTDNKNRIEEIEKILLKNRGIKTHKDKEIFFKSPDPLTFSLKELGFEVKEVKKAVKRIIKAIENKEKIMVYGDYDADGITGTAIVWETLYSQSKNVMPYLPHRVDEGYGFSKKGIDNVIKQYNPNLIITVDNGVTAKEAVKYATSKGIDVIITDHHIIPSNKPNPYSLVHTTKLSGSAVSWFLMREVMLKLNKEVPTPSGRDPDRIVGEKLGLCAIGTVADLLPVTGVNRSIISHGIRQLRITKRPGLLALFKESAVIQKDLDTYHIGYIIAPRINATGRITHGMNSLRLLCTNSDVKAKEYAFDLGETNRERRKITIETAVHADGIFEKNSKNNKNKLIFIYHKSYNQGIIGLVAGRLAEKYYRPAVVLSVGETITKASARSIAGFDIISAIRQSSGLLIDCGGHPMAAGFTIETSKLKMFKGKFEKLVNDTLPDEMLTKKIFIDCEITLADINDKLFQLIQRFKPFGLKNHEPQFVIKNVKPISVRLIGKDRSHLKLELEDGDGIRRTGLAFGLGEMYADFKKDSLVDCVYTLSQNKWNNHTAIEMKIRDIKSSTI